MNLQGFASSRVVALAMAAAPLTWARRKRTQPCGIRTELQRMEGKLSHELDRGEVGLRDAWRIRQSPRRRLPTARPPGAPSCTKRRTMCSSS